MNTETRRMRDLGEIFGLISGNITSIGTIIGLYAGGVDKIPIIIALISVALSDSFSDSLAIYYGSYDTKYALEHGFDAFRSKFLLPMLMIIPFLFFSVQVSVIINSIFSLLLVIYTLRRIVDTRKQMIINLILVLIVISIIFGTGKFISFIGNNV